MKLLVLSDIHGSETGTMTTLELAQRYQPDLVVISGDITNFGPSKWAMEYLNRIPAKTIAVHGNCDPPDLNDIIETSKAINLHKKKVLISGLTFIGAGGSNFTPFNTMFEFGDSTFLRWLGPLMQDHAILVTHAPPHGILDKNFEENHSGSKSLRGLVDRWKPILMICGHLHESRGIELVNDTVFINPGPARHGNGALVDIATPQELECDADDEMWTTIRASIDARLVKA